MEKAEKGSKQAVQEDGGRRKVKQNFSCDLFIEDRYEIMKDHLSEEYRALLPSLRGAAVRR